MSSSDAIVDVHEVPLLSPRQATSHKGDHGRIAIVAGSRGMSGAAVLAGLGALRAGAGLVRVLCPIGVQPVVAASEPSLMTAGLREDDDGRIEGPGSVAWADAARWATVAALGPGLGLSEGVQTAVESAVADWECPLVLDADALNALAVAGTFVEALRARAGRATVLTPHPGEFARLARAAGLADAGTANSAARRTAAAALARIIGAVVVLKGSATLVCAGPVGARPIGAGPVGVEGPVRLYTNTTGNPGMACAGMGDVLTGMIAALIGQGLDGFDAACLAVHVHGAAGDVCAERIGPRGYLAREVAAAVPEALERASRARVGFR